MSWDSWLKTWRIHSGSPLFARRVDRAKDVAVAGAKHGKMFCSLSGGKDSVAMAGILEEVGLAPTVPCVHAHSGLNFPDTLSVVDATVDALNMDLEVIEPADIETHIRRIAKKYGVTAPQPAVSGYTELDLLRTIPLTVDITDALSDVLVVVAAGNMLISYMYEHEFAGSFVGLRADESRARTWYRRMWGADHRNMKDGTHQVCPLLEWTGLDVYAYIVSRGLPIHPYYQAAFEGSRGTVPDPARLRVDLGITPSIIAANGGMTFIRRVYPKMFAELAAIRPELNRYV